MYNDFYVAILFGWFVLLIFWSTIVIFIYFRKPPNSKLTPKIIVKSYLIFFIPIVFFILFDYVDSFY
jgi:hypothetical protein